MNGRTVSEWKEDFKSFINELQLLRDDYNGIMFYIDEGAELLKAQVQEPRLLTFEQIKDIMNGVVWVELKGRQLMDPWIVVHGKIWHPDYNTGYECWDVCKVGEYNRIVRCWSARPTDEQRETVKWDD